MTAPIRDGSGRARAPYTGPTLHCAHWRDQRELDGLHVAVVGGGPALARVVPPVVARARRVTVFQRDPLWILPAPPLPGLPALLRLAPADLLAALPGQAVLRRVAAANLRVQIGDSWQRRQLTPDKPAGVRVHSRYYRALRQPHCTLISWPIARPAPLGIRTVDGVEHRVDCIIYAEDAS
ncbi:hypothetical protein [Nocardia sp. NPDC005825]|uniref:hypothetical protein n=1 Tax=unclassified Nocardia TaxID=2637762 RepID=UPI0033EAE309